MINRLIRPGVDPAGTKLMPQFRPFHWSFYSFVPFTIFILLLDSAWLYGQGINGQIIANILVPLYFIAMIYTLPDHRLKLMMLLTVPVSGVGELILSQGVELWVYKFGYVPLYVPFGHGIMVGTGFQLLWKEGITQRSVALTRDLLIGYGILFLAVWIMARDSFTIVLGLFFFAGVLLMSQRVIYMFMPFFVLFVEFVGTILGCWQWPANPFNTFSTTNPPVGSIMFYIYLDMIVTGLGSYALALRLKWRPG